MATPPPWIELAYQVAKDPASPEARIIKKLPDVLAHGASVLEVSRRLREPPERIAQLMERLAAAEVVSKEGSGMSVQYAGDLYYLRSEGVGFFKYLASLAPSSSSY